MEAANAQSRRHRALCTPYKARDFDLRDPFASRSALSGERVLSEIGLFRTECKLKRQSTITLLNA